MFSIPILTHQDCLNMITTLGNYDTMLIYMSNKTGASFFQTQKAMLHDVGDKYLGIREILRYRVGSNVIDTLI